ncbi:MAG: ComEC/Rec2 family competence protein [Clostridia bacterium]|nr:ComEC/Rec2 family competence protein [Clostridia bacterium]
MNKVTKMRLGLSKSIFTGRRLFTVCASFMIATAVSFFINSAAKLVIIPLLLVLFAVTLAVFIFLRKGKQNSKKRTHLLTAAFCFLLAAISVFQSYAFFDVQYAKYSDIPTEDEQLIRAQVLERRYSSSGMSSYEIELDSVEGYNDLGGTRAILDCTYSGDLQVGDVFTAAVIPTPLSDYSTSIYDEATLIAQGVSIAFASYSDESVTLLNKVDDLPTRLLCMRASLSQKLCVGDGDGGGIAAALLLGDKSHLKDEISRDFSNTGVSHLLALSGLHVTVLFGILDFLLRIFFIPKRVRMPLLGFAALFYLALIGFLPSAVRAVVMMLFAYVAIGLSEDSDPVTALGCAGVLILAASPASVADLGFWMSFFATLGIVTVHPKISNALSRLLEEKRRGKKTFLRRVRRRALISLINLLSGLAVGVTASTFTLWAVSAGGGSFSLLSPLTTLILTPFAGFIIFAAFLLLIFYSTPVSLMLIAAIEIAGGAMAGIAKYFAASSAIHLISLCESFVLPLSAITLILALAPLPILKTGKKRRKSRYAIRMIAVLLSGIFILSSALAVKAYLDRDLLDVTYISPTSQSEYTVFQNGKGAVICEMSNGGSSSLNLAIRAAEESGAVEISAIMITDYHNLTPGTLYKTFARNTVRRLWLPEPTNEKDYYTMLSCIEKAEQAQPPVEVWIYSYGEELTLFNSAALRLYRGGIDRSVQPIFLMTITAADEKAVYLTPTAFECNSEFISLVSSELSDANTLILGRHGPNLKNQYPIESSSVKRLIFGSEEVAAFARVSGGARSADMTVGGARIKMRLRSTK